MKTYLLLAASAAGVVLIAVRSASSGDGKDGGPTGAFSYSPDAQLAAVQRQVKGVVDRYQDGLNSSDFARIRLQFAPTPSPSGTRRQP